MTDEQEPVQEEAQQADAPAAEPVAAPAEEAPAVEAAAMDQSEIDNGKVFAILSYALSFVGIPFFIVPLVMCNNEFSLYHAKQTLMLWLGGIGLSVISGILTIICIGPIIALVGGIFLLVLNIIGLISAINGECKPLPLIGKWAIDWFKGIEKKA